MKILTIEETKTIFLKSQYILFDPIFWEDIFIKLDECNIDFYTIGLEFFGYKELAPILIDLNRVKDKEKLWNTFGEIFYLNATSEFDYMSVFQNIIETDFSLSEFKDYIKSLMVIKIAKEKKIFRFYDSRSMIYAQYFVNSDAKEFKIISQKIKSIKIKNWVINTASHYYSIIDDITEVRPKNSYDLDFFIM